MMDGTGLILGTIDRPWPKFWAALWVLFDSKLDAEKACTRLLGVMSSRGMKKLLPPLVKLSNAVHTAVFAPTGVGKGVSCAIPFLMTCPESCVILDMKGELALATAEHRQKVFGHEIVILDPFNLVTQCEN